jgi:hypothetical protein
MPHQVKQITQVVCICAVRLIYSTIKSKQLMSKAIAAGGLGQIDLLFEAAA